MAFWKVLHAALTIISRITALFCQGGLDRKVAAKGGRRHRPFSLPPDAFCRCRQLKAVEAENAREQYWRKNVQNALEPVFKARLKSTDHHQSALYAL